MEEDDWPIVVYSEFEARVLDDWQKREPSLADPLRSIRRRLRDLLPVVRDTVYATAFDGSFSLKRVAPALTPVTYDDLGSVVDGAAAARAYMRIARGELKEQGATDVCRELERYCQRDTLALVELLQALRGLAADHKPTRK